jgi:alpha-ribazole phosphatase
MKVVLIRHPALLIEPGICYGRLNVPLHPAAASDVARLAADPALCGISRIRSSPAGRCRSVTDTIAASTNAIPTIDERLQELDFGDWEGCPWDAVDKADLDRWAAAPLSFAPPRGESGAAIVSRLRAFHADLQSDQRDCVVVSHGGPLKILTALLVGRPVDLLAAAPPLGWLRTITVRP